MSTARLLAKSLAAGSWSLVMLAGCGSVQEPPAAASNGSQVEEQEAVPASESIEAGRVAELPTLSVGGAGKPEPADQWEPDSPEGIADRIIRDIGNLRAGSLPDTDDVEELSSFRAKRNRKIVELARRAIAKVHHDPEREELFNAAVRHLMEARLQLALGGERADIDALYDDADSLARRAPGSPAAAEAAFVRARFAHANARRFSAREPRWLEEFARQARIFAADFPQEEPRAVMLLDAAGLSCELHGMMDKAIGCYSVIQQQFPQHPKAPQATAALRRLHLEGKPLQLAGPTKQGGYLSIDDFRGEVVLICFWAADSRQFQNQLPQLRALAEKHGESGFHIVGVNLDEEEQAVEEFLEKNPLSWPHIFHTDPTRRRWNHPIVEYYGVRKVPLLWLVDQHGVVVDMHVAPAELDAQVSKLLARGGEANH